MWGTIRVAGQTMDPNHLYGFLKELQAHERTGFFELDGEVKRFMKEHGNLVGGKRKYLEAHHGNVWVTRGRIDEALASLGVNDSGFRNHAEAIMSAMKDLDVRELYLASRYFL